MTKLNKANLAVRRLASSESSRYVINGIKIDPLATIATDGHVLGIVALPIQDDGVVVEPRIMPSADAQRGEALTNGNKALELDGNVLRGVKGAIQTEPIDGRFPDWQAVAPKDYDKGFSIYANPELLRNMADFLERACGKVAKPCIRMTFSPKKEAEKSVIRFDAWTEDHCAITGLVMPMNSVDDIPLHTWTAVAKPELVKA